MARSSFPDDRAYPVGPLAVASNLVNAPCVIGRQTKCHDE